MIESKNGTHVITCDSCGKVIDTTTGENDIYFRNRANYNSYINIDGKLMLNANGDICIECHTIVTEDFRKAFKDVCDKYKLGFSVESNY